jgi:hypothetical protein
MTQKDDEKTNDEILDMQEILEGDMEDAERAESALEE